MTRKSHSKRASYGAEEEAAAGAEAATAIDFIETHLLEDLTVTRIAKACAASEFHFSRRFSRRQGEGVMSYVRGRRLDLAAQRLRSEPDASIVEIALNSRFDSPAAFSRAFARAFGIAPSGYRKSSDLYVRKRKATMTPSPDIRESIEYVDTFHVAGLAGHFDPSTFTRIGALWKGFVARMNFEGRLGEGETCGVFRNRDFSAHQFDHLAGARIVAGQRPEGLEVWTLPGRNYLVYEQMLIEGDLHPQVAAAQTEIWGKRVPRSGKALARAADFQIYPANFKVGVGGWLAYYIPIE